MKLRRVRPLIHHKDDAGNEWVEYSVMLGRGPSAKELSLDLALEPGQYDNQKTQPVVMSKQQEGFLKGERGVFYHDYLYGIEDAGQLQENELLLRVKHFALKSEQDFTRIAREVEAFEQVVEADTARRERIPSSIKLFVWQRDEGKCVSCGSKVRLEFDHIIPVAEGGSTTERNIQILCEHCNRSKGKQIM